VAVQVQAGVRAAAGEVVARPLAPQAEKKKGNERPQVPGRPPASTSPATLVRVLLNHGCSLRIGILKTMLVE
jgi:hypothetical protein